MKKLGIFVLAFLLFILSPFAISIIINNSIRWNLAKKLYRLPLPENVKVIDRKAECGKLFGNGNGMEFLATMLVESDLSKEDLEKYYKNRKIKFYWFGEKMELKVEVNEQKNENLSIDDGYHGEISYKNMRKEREGHYYSIIVFGPSYGGGFDLRAH